METAAEKVDEVRDRVRFTSVAAVLVVLATYVYLFTQASVSVGLSLPEDAAYELGLESEDIFDSGGNVDSNLWLAETSQRDDRHYGSDHERLILFGSIAGAFLCTYFLPRRWRKHSMVAWFLIAFLPLYGMRATCLFLSAHLLAYLTFHPRSTERQSVSAALGATIGLSVVLGGELVAETQLLVAAVCGVAGMLAWQRWMVPLLTAPVVPDMLRTALVQFPLVFTVLGAFADSMDGNVWALPLGLLLFVWQWERMLVYHADFKDGKVPEQLPLSEYLAVFLTPAALTNWTYSPYVGQAYSYQADRYLRRDRDRILWSGVQLLCLALLYLVFGEWIVDRACEGLDRYCGITAYPWTSKLVREFMAGTPTNTATVLTTTLLYQFRVILVFGAVCHFRVGVWRILGYDMEPQYDKPWMATNLVTFWRRFAFHYREFLVRVFYYPIFFRVFRKNPRMRIFVATVLATSVGNHFWGHIPDRLYYRGLTMDNMVMILRAWPYYLLLGLAIGLTQVYLLKRKRRRKPWTLDRWIPGDVLAAYATVQFFALISVFARPPVNGTLWDSTRLFLRGFGMTL